MDTHRFSARARLVAFLPRAMEDGILDEDEKRELMALLGSGVLTKDDVQDIFREFLESVQQSVMHDGHLTPDERNRCRDIVRELRIPRDFISPDMGWIIDEE